MTGCFGCGVVAQEPTFSFLIVCIRIDATCSSMGVCVTGKKTAEYCRRWCAVICDDGSKDAGGRCCEDVAAVFC